jgi:hypothetical protein
MSNVRRKDVTTPCRKCGAAMVIVRVWPLPAAVDHVEVHMFKCEFCSATEFYRFKTAALPPNENAERAGASVPDGRGFEIDWSAPMSAGHMTALS